MANTREQAQLILYHSEYLWAECECLLKEQIAGSKTVCLSSAQQAALIQEVIDGADAVADYEFHEAAQTDLRSTLPKVFETRRHVIAHKAVALWNRTAGAMQCDPMEAADQVLVSGLPAGPPETQVLVGVLSRLGLVAEQVMTERLKRDLGMDSSGQTVSSVAGASENTLAGRDGIDIEELRERISTLKDRIESGIREESECALERVEWEIDRLIHGQAEECSPMTARKVAGSSSSLRTPEQRKLEAEKTVTWFRNYNTLRVEIEHLQPPMGHANEEQLLALASKIAQIRQQFAGGQAAAHAPEPEAQNGAVEDETAADPFATPELRKAAVEREKGCGTMKALALRWGLGPYGANEIWTWIRLRVEGWSKRGKSKKASRIEERLKEAERARSLSETHAKLSAP